MSSKKRKLSTKHNKGFTLIEVVVTLIIFTTITIYSAANLSSSNTKNKLIIARDTMVNDIRKMQTWAQSGRKCTASDNATICVATSGKNYPYGFYIEKNVSCETATCQYTMFVDKCTSDSLCPGTNSNVFDSTEELIEGIKDIRGVKSVKTQSRIFSADFIDVDDIAFVFNPFTSEMIMNDEAEIIQAKIILRNDLNAIEIIIDKESGTIVQKGLTDI